MKTNFGQVYQNVIITLIFAFVFLNATPNQKSEIIKITMNALDSANQIIVKVQADTIIVSDTLKIDTCKEFVFQNK